MTFSVSKEGGPRASPFDSHIVRGTRQPRLDEITRARRYVAANAVDREELEMFLSMLGLEREP